MSMLCARARWLLLFSLVSALPVPAAPRQREGARADGDSTSARLTPDGARVVFADDPDGDGALDLFSVSAEGASTPVRLGGPLDSPIGRPWTLTADGRGVVFVAGGLFVAPVDGSAPALALADGLVHDFALSTSGKRVAYRAGPSSLYAGLYVAALGGAGAPLELVAPNPRGEVLRYAFAPDERALVFTSVHAGGAAARLYRVALDGGAPVELDRACANVSDFAITSDGERVLFRARGASESRHRLFTIPLDAAEGAVPLCDPAAPDADVRDFRVSADGAWVVFLSERGENGRNDLFSARTDASAPPVSLAAALAPAACVVDAFALDAGSQRVVYAADPHRAEQFELYASALDGRSAPVRLDAPSARGSAGWYELLPDGASAVYEEHDYAEHVEPGASTLWRVSLADPSRRVELARVRAPSDFLLSADGRRLALLEHRGQGAELCALALDGDLPPVRRPEISASGFQLGADGSWCLARATDDESSAKGAGSRWRRIPLDGTSPSPLVAWPPAAHIARARASSSGAASGGRIALGGDAGFRDFSFGLSGSSTPTGEKPECKLWWNDGFWWGDLYDDASQDHHVFRLDWASQTWLDTGIALDTRGSSKGDILWDAEGRKLYVASHIFSTSAHSTTSNFGRLFRYTYEGKAYTRDDGFPVDITDGNAEALTIAKDSTGRLWATWVEDQQVMINHSAGADEKWDTPVLLPVDPSTATGLTTDEISAIIAFGDRVGVMWSNQATTQTYFAVHLDADPPGLWQTPEVVVPDGVNCASLCSDDLFSLKTLDGRVFVALKTSQEGADDALILVCVRAPDGAWSSTVFGRVQDHHTRPILLLDQQSREMYVFATHPEDSGAVFYKHTPLDDVHFEPGLGTPFIQNAVDVTINNPTSTKQNLDSQTHLVVLASDHDTRFYLHNVLDLGGGPLPPTISTFTPASGTVGTPVTIDGSNLATTTTVSFGGTDASFTVVSDAQIQTAVPDGATTGRIVVTNAAGTATSASDFTVVRVPTVDVFLPASGWVGTIVKLEGTDLDAATDVSFNGVSAAFSVATGSTTSLEAVVPAGATTGRITITTPAGTATSTSDFVVRRTPALGSPPRSRRGAPGNPSSTTSTPSSGDSGMR